MRQWVGILDEENSRVQFKNSKPAKLIEYEFSEIVADTFSYAVEIGKVHIAFYIYKLFKDDIEDV